MKRLALLLCAAATAAVVLSSAGSLRAEPLAGWTADLDRALATAKKENKPLLVEFTGSDWCPGCIAMRQQVFSKPEFVKAAGKKFILVEIDMPKRDPKLAEKNRPLVEKYKIQGYPTVMLLSAEGKEFDRFPATECPKPELFLKRLDRALDRKDLD